MANDDEPAVLLVLLALAAAVYAAAWMTEPDQEPQLSLGTEMAMPDLPAPNRHDISLSPTATQSETRPHPWDGASLQPQ